MDGEVDKVDKVNKAVRGSQRLFCRASALREFADLEAGRGATIRSARGKG